MCTFQFLYLFSHGLVAIYRLQDSYEVKEVNSRKAVYTWRIWGCSPWIPSQLLDSPPCMTSKALTTLPHKRCCPLAQIQQWNNLLVPQMHFELTKSSIIAVVGVLCRVTTVQMQVRDTACRTP